MDYLSVIMKPRVKALLDLDPFQRGEHWLEELAAASFDLDSWELVTKEQRNWAKLNYYAYIYGASFAYGAESFKKLYTIVIDTQEKAEALSEAFRKAYPQLAAYQMIAQSQKYVGTLNCNLIILDELSAPKVHKLPKADKRTRSSSKTGATWPKPRGSY